MLTPDVLISPFYSQDALDVAGPSKTFNYYIHKSSGFIDVSLTTSYEQTISTLVPSDHLLNHISNQLTLISNRIDLTFNEVDYRDAADISIFVDQEINLGDSSVDTLGLALTNRDFDSGRVWFEIFLNGPAIYMHEPDILAYVFNHELLHVLGLEHTFDDSDGDFYLSTDPNLSATPEETVMSYRAPISEYPSDITESDYSALEKIWGRSSINNIQSSGFDTTYIVYTILFKILICLLLISTR